MNSYIMRKWATRLVVYVFLSAVAYLMLFPFTYMVFTSFKESTDVFTSPPRLLPHSEITATYQGQELPLYELEVDGKLLQMVLTEEKITIGRFTTENLINVETPTDSQMVIELPLDQAVETGEKITLTDPKTGRSRDFDLYEVPINVETQKLILAHRPKWPIFVDPDNPDIRAYASELTAKPIEKVEFQFDNYETLLSGGKNTGSSVDLNMNRALINTILVTFGVTFGQLITSIFGGYAFARVPFPGRDTLFILYLGSIMIPFVVLIIPMYRLMVVLGWNDKIVSLIIPWIFTAYGTFLMRQFFLSIPKEIEEAALLDGCSRFRILWTIFVPLSMPAVATQTIFTFLYAWNSFLWPFIIISIDNKESRVLTLMLIQLRNIAADRPNLMMTGAAVAIIPPILVFILAQRYFIESVSSSAVKG